MRTILAWLLLVVVLRASFAADAADVGIATLIEGDAKVLRGTTWYKLVPGAVLEDADIVDVRERGSVHVEFATGDAANLVGPGTLYLSPPSVKSGEAKAPRLITLPRGWLKLVAKPPGVRLRTAPVDIVTAEGILVVHADGGALRLYVESGNARLIELRPNGTDGASKEAKPSEYWSKPLAAPFATAAHPPREFVSAMPKHFVDRLPAFAAKFKSRPTLAADHEVTFAEAEPWLAGRERAVFERRFASRLRDPAFRREVEPQVGRYPSWDRMLHPEKYAPKPAAQ